MAIEPKDITKESVSIFMNANHRICEMAIDTSIKTRINLTIELDLKQKVEQLAKEDERSTNSMIIKLIKEALQARGEL